MMLNLLRRNSGLLRMFLGIMFFMKALDAGIALNRWWLDGGYLENLFWLTFGSVLFILLFSRNKRQILGLSLLAVAIYFVCDYEIGGPSKFYLSPFDPLFGVRPTFFDNSIIYRKVMAYLFSIAAALVLVLSKRKISENQIITKE